jgi:mRNA interferase MazF
VRPAVVIANDRYRAEKPDVLVAILTTKIPARLDSTDYILTDWLLAGLRAQSCFRAFVITMHRSNLTVIGHVSARDWTGVTACVRKAFAVL